MYRLLALAMIVMVFTSGCSLFTSQPKADTPDKPTAAGQVTPSPLPFAPGGGSPTTLNTPAAETTTVPEVEIVAEPTPTTPAVKTFTLTAQQWAFTPATLTVKKGDTVTITLTSTDVAHSFALPEFNINQRVEPGQPVTFSFVADTAGSFTFACRVPCGTGHQTMTGTLVVTE